MKTMIEEGMTELVNAITQFISEEKFITTVILLVFVLVIREGIVSSLRKGARKKRVDRRATISAIRNLTNFLLFIAVLLIWSENIKDFALSIAAFTVAIILATREYVQCLLGFIYISSTRSFSVGDWIEVDGSIGEVANRDWLKVTLLEIDKTCYAYTGKTLSIPNNRFVTQSVKNLNFLRRYATHTFHIVTDAEKNIVPFKERLLKKAIKYCEPFHDVAQRYSILIEKRLDVSIHGPEPDIQIQTNELANRVLAVTIFCPTELALEIEQKLTCDFLTMWHEK